MHPSCTLSAGFARQTLKPVLLLSRRSIKPESSASARLLPASNALTDTGAKFKQSPQLWAVCGDSLIRNFRTIAFASAGLPTIVNLAFARAEGPPVSSEDAVEGKETHRHRYADPGHRAGRDAPSRRVAQISCSIYALCRFLCLCDRDQHYDTLHRGRL